MTEASETSTPITAMVRRAASLSARPRLAVYGRETREATYHLLAVMFDYDLACQFATEQVEMKGLQMVWVCEAVAGRDLPVSFDELPAGLQRVASIGR
jgi:hypothetical protein